MTDDTPQQQEQPQREPGPVPYSRFKQVNDELKQVKQQIAEREAAATDEAATAEQPDEAQQIAELRAKLAEAELANLRNEVGMELDLPWAITRRLRGTDRDSLRDDAAYLLRMLNNPKNHQIAGSAGLPDITQQQIADPGFYARNRDRILAAVKYGRLG
jgi:hypothetical protein